MIGGMRMKQLFQSKKTLIIVPVLFLILTGCSFAGIRSPLYDGKPVEPNESAIKQYVQTQQINAENEAYYFRHPLSDSLFEPSLEFSDKETVTLNVGTYEVGEDLPEGRVILEGHPSDFSPQVFTIRAGNVTVFDDNGLVTFENHFQERIGVMQAVVDLREGQTVNVDGESSEIYVHYNKKTLLNPFDMEADAKPELASTETLRAGHYEVGKHIEAGSYMLEDFAAPRTAVLYHFTEKTVKVVELTANRGLKPSASELNEARYETEDVSEEDKKDEQTDAPYQSVKPVIHLKEGDKLYLPMLDWLKLKVN